MRCIWDPPRRWCPQFDRCDPGTALACFAKEKIAYLPFSSSKITEEGARVLKEEFEKRLREAGG